MREHWLIIGASSAVARAFARQVAAEGALLTLAGRDAADLDAIARDAQLRGSPLARWVECDVADPRSRANLLAQAVIEDTRLNVLVAAGLMPEQHAMDRDPEQVSAMIGATYSGPLNLLQGLAPHLEQQKGGQVVVITSVAGDRGRKKNYLYGSAKAGLAVYAEGLRARLFDSGANVLVVKPGFVDTAMTWGLPGLFLVSSPESCAHAIVKASGAGKNCLYYPRFWMLVLLVIRHIPAGVMKRLNF